ncbi:hypothetical protein BDV35DRAFT_339301 [Aspergillus flavus]|uniref:Uncharacterized protein n=1 Tax=Aspergillus flavus TaxID=5059 RepID=A0A5N6HAT5_ASPFL|nr:hypothetical protein BDV35DRAFT_339301 [Aspergillus flavus]
MAHTRLWFPESEPVPAPRNRRLRTQKCSICSCNRSCTHTTIHQSCRQFSRHTSVSQSGRKCTSYARITRFFILSSEVG